MMKNLCLALIFIATPYVARADYDQASVDNYSIYNAQVPTVWGRCLGGKGSNILCRSEFANFFLVPGNQPVVTIAGNALPSDGTVIENNGCVQWDPTLFTIKTPGININSDSSGGVKPTTCSVIVFTHPGIYLVTYSVFASLGLLDAQAAVFEGSTYSMELQLNGCPVCGSRFTQSLPLLSNDLSIFLRGPSELTGQVVLYIPAGGRLRLVNVTGAPIQLDTSGGKTGVLASIYISQISS